MAGEWGVAVEEGFHVVVCCGEAVVEGDGVHSADGVGCVEGDAVQVDGAVWILDELEVVSVAVVADRVGFGDYGWWFVLDVRVCGDDQGGGFEAVLREFELCDVFAAAGVEVLADEVVEWPSGFCFVDVVWVVVVCDGVECCAWCRNVCVRGFEHLWSCSVAVGCLAEDTARSGDAVRVGRAGRGFSLPRAVLFFSHVLPATFL